MIPGVPRSTSYALDRLDRPHVNSERVREALATYARIASMPTARLTWPVDDWVLESAPRARDVLEAAMLALDRRHAAPLRRAVARVDALFTARTLPDLWTWTDVPQRRSRAPSRGEGERQATDAASDRCAAQ